MQSIRHSSLALIISIIAAMTSLSAFEARAQGTGLAPFSLKEAAFEKVVQGDPSVLANLSGKVVVIMLLRHDLDVLGKATEPPASWKGSKAEWAKARRQIAESRELTDKMITENVKEFHALHRRFGGEAVFFGRLYPFPNVANALALAKATGFTLPIVQSGNGSSLPTNMAEEMVIFGQNGHAFYHGKVGSEAEKILKQLLKR
jgi:hypothetical protein